MSHHHPKVDQYLSRATQWREIQEELRSILLKTGLTEELKWGKPCYTFQGKNVVIVQAFKEFCALLFFKGALLPDPAGMLNKQGPNSHTSRRLQFTHAEEVISNVPAIKAYLDAAIDVEKSGKQVPFNAKNELTYPEELQFKLNEDHQLKLAFEGLTPGRIRGYVMHISSAKQSATRTSRIQKCIPKILKGKGFNERP